MAGPFFYAWVDGPVDFDPIAHAVEDEAITELVISQEEGGFAGLQITVLNTGEGLLAAGRLQWCWLSWDDGSEILPLFHGRLIAVPESLDGEAMRLLFSARPPGYDGIKDALAASLKLLPYWDEVWITSDLDDADAVLNTYGAQWHIDRTTLELTISDELEGEDGVIVIGEADHFYDDFSLSYADPPKSRVDLDATLTWRQTGTGTIDLTQRISRAFADAKTIYTYTDHGLITTLTGDGLLNAWPEGGTSLGGGWTVSNDTTCGDASEGFTRYEYTTTTRGLRPDYTGEEKLESRSDYYFSAYQDYEITYEVAAFEQHTLFDWEADRGRTEILRVSLYADIQPLLAEPEDEDNILKLTISAVDTVTEPDGSGVLPIGDTRRMSYLPTDRGRASVEHLLLLARAELRRSARAVEVGCRVPWEQGIAVNLRRSAHIVDPRAPGGAAIGKIISYALAASGSGENACNFTIGCAIGLGGTVSANAGTPVYVEDDYVTGVYQQVAGAEYLAPTGDIAWQTLDDTVVDDDGVDLLTLDETTAVESLVVDNGLGEQVVIIEGSDDPSLALKAQPTEVCLQLVPLTDKEFETIFEPMVQTIPLPRLIDLEAAAA